MNGPLVKWENVYEAAKRLTENLASRAWKSTSPTRRSAGEQGQAGRTAARPAQPDPAMELQAKHALEMDKARLDSETKIMVARIGAEKDIIIAGLQPPLELTPDNMAPQMAQEAPQQPEGPEPAPEPAFAPQGPDMGDYGAYQPQMPDEIAGDMA
jgi:hypothetical protein